MELEMYKEKVLLSLDTSRNNQSSDLGGGWLAVLDSVGRKDNMVDTTFPGAASRSGAARSEPPSLGISPKLCGHGAFLARGFAQLREQCESVAALQKRTEESSAQRSVND